MEAQMSMLKNAAFDEFVKSQQEPAHPEIDWNKKRDEWLERLDELYGRIHEFLTRYVDEGQIQIESQPIDLYEENIGAYSAKQLTVKIGRKRVLFRPVGTLLIGSKGRVDVIGPRGTSVPMLLIDSKARKASDLIRVQVGVDGKLPEVPKRGPGEVSWEWKMITRPPERRFIELNPETFYEMILEVANG
jgi:hypothetical protein